MKILLIDNYDSFTFNLYHYISSLNTIVEKTLVNFSNKTELKQMPLSIIQSNNSDLSRYIVQYELRSKGKIVASGTDAICLCLKLLGIKAGDEVITTSFTAFPTILAILMASAKPVFADIDYDTWLISKEDIMRKITKKTKAIIPVHIFGNVFDVDNLKGVIPKKICIIEDAAQAHGSMINGKKAGSL